MHSTTQAIPWARSTPGYRWPESTRQTTPSPPSLRATRIGSASRSTAPPPLRECPDAVALANPARHRSPSAMLPPAPHAWPPDRIQEHRPMASTAAAADIVLPGNEPVPAPPRGRVASLDQFRGYTVAG